MAASLNLRSQQLFQDGEIEILRDHHAREKRINRRRRQSRGLFLHFGFAQATSAITITKDPARKSIDKLKIRAHSSDQNFPSFGFRNNTILGNRCGKSRNKSRKPEEILVIVNWNRDSPHIVSANYDDILHPVSGLTAISTIGRSQLLEKLITLERVKLPQSSMGGREPQQQVPPIVTAKNSTSSNTSYTAQCQENRSTFIVTLPN